MPVLAAVLAAAAPSSSPSPYAGQETRQIKALSPDEIADLLAGRGMGLAKAAELNGYPGPAHVLELADRLGLGPEQRRDIEAIHTRMANAAKPLGADIVKDERELDAQFAGGTITEAQLWKETAAIAELKGRLRAAHLAAHIATRAVLTPAQIAQYQALRGYGAAAAPAPEAHEHHME